MTVKTPVYLDYAATTPVDKRVAEKMIPYLTETFGNPASNSHAFGWEAEEAVEKARADIAALINADPKEIIFTSGATESDNLAIKGAANFYKTKGKHLIILALATTAGYGIAGITLQLANGSFDIAAWKPFALLVGSIWLLVPITSTNA